MRILLTGSRGMLGSSIKKHLNDPKFDLLSPTSADLNLLDGEAVHEYIKTQKPDAVIHAAARVGGIQANIDSPYEFLTENIRMDSNLLSASLEYKVPNLLYMASSCMYPRETFQPMKESQILTGALEPTNEGYALAKLVATKTVELASNQYGLNWRSLILSNLFGPGDHFNSDKSHLLAAIITKVEAAKRTNSPEITMWGTGNVRREFTYVEDVADFIATKIFSLKDLPALLNIGLGQDYSVIEYYQMVAQYAGYAGKITADASKPEGMRQKLMNIEVAQKLGWNPTTNMTDAIAKTYDWYIDSMRGNI
jgi:nucleoside-diphosphate-sugar epimerase